MLVLSRKIGDKIVIGDNITVVVHRIQGNRVSLGIEAPPKVRIVRGELNRTPEPDESPAPGASQQRMENLSRSPILNLSAFDLSSELPIHRAR